MDGGREEAKEREKQKETKNSIFNDNKNSTEMTLCSNKNVQHEQLLTFINI